MLHHLEKWITEQQEIVPQLWKDMIDLVQDILHGTELKNVLQRVFDKDTRFSNYVIDKYDYLFRCTRLLSLKELLSVI